MLEKENKAIPIKEILGNYHGWKTYIAGGISILIGLAGLFTARLSIDNCVAFIVGGGAIIGIGDKLNKIINGLN